MHTMEMEGCYPKLRPQMECSRGFPKRSDITRFEVEGHLKFKGSVPGLLHDCSRTVQTSIEALPLAKQTAELTTEQTT